MKMTVTEYDLQDWFANSSIYKNNFTPAGISVLFEMLEDYEESTGEELDFDPVAFCCGYSEYASAVEALKDNNLWDEAEEDSLDGMEEDEVEEWALDILRDHTMVWTFEGGIIAQVF